MIMKLSVLIRFESDAMTSTSRSCQERRRSPAVKVVDHIVLCSSKLASDARTCHKSATLQRDHVVNLWMIVEHGRDPILDQDVYLCIWEKSFQGEERRRRQDRVANRSETNDQNLAHVAPVPARRCQGLGRVLTLKSIHCLCFDDA